MQRGSRKNGSRFDDYSTIAVYLLLEELIKAI